VIKNTAAVKLEFLAVSLKLFWFQKSRLLLADTVEKLFLGRPSEILVVTDAAAPKPAEPLPRTASI
jgi:hypothetical protein